MMTRHERLMATLRGEPVDRPPVSFYEIGGWDLRVRLDDPDPFNVYNDPSWRSLVELAEEKTDLIRMINVPWTGGTTREIDEFAQADSQPSPSRSESWTEGTSRFTRTTLSLGSRELTQITRRDAETMTTWVIEHFFKSIEDVKAFVDSPPDPPETGEPDVAAFEAMEAQLGQAGIASIEFGDPLCEAAGMFSMEDYTITAMTEPVLFHRLLERFAERLYPRVEKVARMLPGRLWRICGSEYASEPYLPPRLYEEYLVRYNRPMVEAIQNHGGFARIHSHGNLRGIIGHLASMGIAGLDPCEPPPQGDMNLAELREAIGRDTVLFGNIEASDIEALSPAAFEAKVYAALKEGTTGEGRGFILMPSSCPYGRTISDTVLTNYKTMVRMAETWGQ
jgi:uroporphyrinogen-III decarboxylase